MTVVINRPLQGGDEAGAGAAAAAVLAPQHDQEVNRPRNLGFIHANLLAGDLQSILSDLAAAHAHIHCVAVQFPDPHWKGKNRKRRMLTPSLLRTAAAYLAPGGMFYLQSDVRDVVVDVKRDVQSQTNNLLVLYSSVITSLPSDAVSAIATAESSHCRVSQRALVGEGRKEEEGGSFQVVTVFSGGDEAEDEDVTVDDISAQDVASEENLIEDAIAAAVAVPAAADGDPDSPSSYRIVRVYSNEDEAIDDVAFDDVAFDDVVPESGSIDDDCVCGEDCDSPSSYQVIRVYSNEDEATDLLTVDDIRAEDVVPEEFGLENPLGCDVCAFDHDADAEYAEDSDFLLSVFSDSNMRERDNEVAADAHDTMLGPKDVSMIQRIEHVDDVSEYVPRCFTEVPTERCLYVARRGKSVHHIVLRMNNVALSKRNVMSDLKSQSNCK